MYTHTQTANGISTSLAPSDAAITDMLLQMEILSHDVIASLRKQSGGSEAAFESLLLRAGFVSDSQLSQLKAQAHGWKFIDLSREYISEQEYALLPKAFAVSRGLVLFRRSQDAHWSIAAINPDDRHTLRLLRKKFGNKLPVYYASPSSMASEHVHYDTRFEERCDAILREHQQAKLSVGTIDDSIIELVEAMLLHAVRQNASDVHIEPNAVDTVVRERVDGLLRTVLRFSREVHYLAVLRMKVIANLATDEHMAPQDGKFLFEAPGGKRVDVRISIIATTNGEKVVLRLLASQDQPLLLSSLGMEERDSAIMEYECGRSWGMVLVTGPTGSGKTTTLYSVMRKLNDDTVNISTIEDPVEYDLPGANQIQVNEKAGVSFATGLRSIVRQDPNIVLVGEIRDPETASIAVNAAMTGHLVLSTLHTNNAATALPRLIDMDVEPFLLSSTLNAIVAQRLVRTICVRCREGYDVSTKDLKDILPAEVLKKITTKRNKFRFFRGVGCPLCSGSGFLGRSGIFEILQVTKEIRALIMQRSDADAVQQAAWAAGMTTMLDDGMVKVLQGITTVEEVLRVIRS